MISVTIGRKTTEHPSEYPPITKVQWPISEVDPVVFQVGRWTALIMPARIAR